MKLLAEISAGELIERIIILEIKRANIDDEAKLANIACEYGALIDVLHREVESDEAITDLRGELKEVNAALWRIENAIREQERAKTF
jgi:hypothetical protein